MKVTGALLAESAGVVDGKLNIEGGFLRSYRAGIDRVATVTLVVFTEFQAGDDNPVLTVRFTTPDGDSQSEQIAMPHTSGPGEAGYAIWPLWIPVEINGRYLLAISGEEGLVTLDLTVQDDDD